MWLKYPWVIALGIFMAMFIAACGSSTTPGGGLYGSGNTSPPASTNGGKISSTMLQTATVIVNRTSNSLFSATENLTR